MNAYNLFSELTFDHRYGKIYNRNLPTAYKRELDSRIPIVPSPDHIHLFVIGGAAGRFSAFIPGWGHMSSPVLRGIEGSGPSGADLRRRHVLSLSRHARQSCRMQSARESRAPGPDADLRRLHFRRASRNGQARLRGDGPIRPSSIRAGWSRPSSARSAPRAPTLEGLRLGILDNTKWNANRLLRKTAARLEAEHGIAAVNYYRKESFSKEADPALIARSPTTTTSS